MQPNFTHVSIMEKIPLGFIVHDPNFQALDTYVLPAESTEAFLAAYLKQQPGTTIVEVTKAAVHHERGLIRFGLQSCVSVVAYILSLRLPWYVVTPYQLFKRLKPNRDGIISVRRL